MIRVTVWNEYLHETRQPEIAAIYPKGIHGCIADFLGAEEDISVRTATLCEPQNGLPEELLADTDVLIWWGHWEHNSVEDATVQRVQRHILGGMGFIPLHAAHHSKLMKALMGTTLNLKWRHDDRERLWCCSPSHPIARGVPQQFELPVEEMYGEPFDIPNPDEVIFLGWFAGGEVFRSGVTFTRGRGRIFYFQPGHEQYPIYFDKNIQRVIINAVRWAYNPENGQHCEIPVESAPPPEKNR